MGAFAVLEPYWLVFFEYFCFLKLIFYFRKSAFLFTEQVLSVDLIKFGRYFKLFTNPQSKFTMDEPIESQAEKQQESFGNIIYSWIKQHYQRILTAGTILIALILWITKNKEPELITNVRGTATELRNCIHDDIITGTITLDGKIMKGTIISLNVHNKFSKGFEKKKDNEITIQNGTFRFSLCKATSDYVEFEVTTLTKPLVKECKVDSIPNIIEF
jgi:hypothetical protein